jgi:hypothetical protein
MARSCFLGQTIEVFMWCKIISGGAIFMLFLLYFSYVLIVIMCIISHAVFLLN